MLLFIYHRKNNTQRHTNKKKSHLPRSVCLVLLLSSPIRQGLPQYLPTHSPCCLMAVHHFTCVFSLALCLSASPPTTTLPITPLSPLFSIFLPLLPTHLAHLSTHRLTLCVSNPVGCAFTTVKPNRSDPLHSLSHRNPHRHSGSSHHLDHRPSRTDSSTTPNTTQSTTSITTRVLPKAQHRAKPKPNHKYNLKYNRNYNTKHKPKRKITALRIKVLWRLRNEVGLSSITSQRA